MSVPSKPHWDLFCRVVDNFGDIGVCWRLARILAVEHGIATRLVIDRPEILEKIASSYKDYSKTYTYSLIEVVRWSDSIRPSTDTCVLVEVFACDPPAPYLAAMAELARPPLWINLEYLSAESWVAGCHGLLSRHPRLGIDKLFMIPGFDHASAGLLRESSLDEQRRRFLSDPEARAAMWCRLGVPPPAPGELRASLFGYENPLVAKLLEALARDPRPVTVVVPEGRSVADLSRRLGLGLARAGDAWRDGSLQLRVVPFTDQDAYDRLLWSCDLNMVRGEDSLVRALWAGRAMLWQAYPQQDDDHHAKVEALLDRLLLFLEPAAVADAAALWRHWNGMSGREPAWTRVGRTVGALASAVAAWRQVLGKGPELATSLVKAAASQIE